MKQLKGEWIWHIVFWTGYLLIKIFIVEYFRENLAIVFYVELISLPLKMFLAYALNLYLIPKFLLKRKFVHFATWLVGLVFFAAFARRVTDVYLAYPITQLYFDNSEFWDLGTAFRNLIYIYPVVGLATAIYLMSHWIKDYQIKNQLQQEKLQIELQSLKAQVHPHFLFNTINNIYSLSLDQSPKTSQALLELSDLLSFMLYECQVDRITLTKEIQHIQNYFNLERLRYGERLDFQFEVSGELKDITIAPLLLLPFVDNCFKHGASDSLAQCFVHFHLKVEGGILYLNLKNSISGKLIDDNPNSGIGLVNVKRRLKGEYQERFNLRIQEDLKMYEVDLKIDLNE